MSKKTIMVLSIIAVLVVLTAIGFGVHHFMNPEMPPVM